MVCCSSAYISMSSLRLEELPFELSGKTYLLRCNMAVLETVQEAHGGNFDEVMDMPVKESALEFLAAMLNDYAAEQDWPEVWEPAALKRKVSLAMLTDIFGMVTRSLTPQKQKKEPTPVAEKGN